MGNRESRRVGPNQDGGEVKRDYRDSSRLLELLRIKGATVTIDAMGCQKDIAKQIVAGKADYMLAVKENQPTLHSDIVALFNRAAKDPDFLDGLDFCETTSKGHGRVEVDRTVDGKTSTEQRYYIASKQRLRAKTALSIVRSHWGTENELHWVLDVASREDDCHVRAGYAAENFAVMRHITPRADAGGPYSTYVGVSNGLLLDGSASADPDIACGDRIVTYEWDIDGTGRFVASPDAAIRLTWPDMRPAKPLRQAKSG